MRNFVLALLLTLVGCAAHVGGRANYRELTVAKHWTNAQRLLAERTRYRSFDVPYGIINWKFSKDPVRLYEEDGSFKLGMGYFDPVTMEIFISLPSIPGLTVEHEACHAILFLLHDPGWITYCHDPARPWYMRVQND